jgi:transcriptional regulator with PAS, ATPase and Fis domain
MEAPNWLGHPLAAKVLGLHNSESLIDIDDGDELGWAIVDAIREPLLVLDKDLRVIIANRSFYLMFRMNRQDVQGRPLLR